SNPNLPFGGSNNSGIGKGNGIFGFKAFSNAKAVQNHWAPFDGMKGFYPPYNQDKVNLIEKVVKWFA
ncbi:MAG: aldehyde dehydrogenase family protein, partial [Bacteroidota bacterium]